MQNPININVIDNFLLPHECAYYIQQKQNELVRSTVVSHTDFSSVVDECRTSSGSWFQNNDDPYIKYLRFQISALTRIN